KKVSLYKTGEPDSRAVYQMFDISRGGLSFLVSQEDLFQKGDYIEVVALEDDELDTILIGEVMNIRTQEETWKVGVKFVDKIPTQES
ncbi:MAG: PilZ domain-containing protein, partial [Proteobacteria bacterium]|nr:PilZ domain-containing protein [Pseudomonadota bacterium]